MSDWLPTFLSRLAWAVAIAIAVVGNVSAVLGMIDPFEGLVASVPFLLLAFGRLSDENPSPSAVDGAHEPSILDPQPGGDVPPGPSMGS